MSLISKYFHDSKSIVLVAVPNKGPIICHLNKATDAKEVYTAFKELTAKIHNVRPDRQNNRLVLSFGEAAALFVVKNEGLSRLVSTFGISGYQVSGLLDKSSKNDELVEISDFPIVSSHITYQDILNYSDCVRMEFELKQELESWEEALIEDRSFNHRRLMNDWDEALIEDECRAWNEALSLDRIFNHKRLIVAWDEALIEDKKYNLIQEEKAWNEALIEDNKFELILESRAWEEALVFNKIYNKKQELNAWNEAEIINNKLNVLNRFSSDAQQALIFGDFNQEKATLRSMAITLMGSIDEVNHLSNVFEKAVRGVPVPEFKETPVEVKPNKVIVAPDIGSHLANANRVASEENKVRGKASFDSVDVLEAPVKQKVWHRHEEIIRGGCIFTSKEPLILTGRVAFDAEVRCEDSIELLGPTAGRIFAGHANNKKATITCHNFQAQLVSIAGIYTTLADLPSEVRGKKVKFWLDGDKLLFSILS